jgi:suppressor for copper-sensitivity B
VLVLLIWKSTMMPPVLRWTALLLTLTAAFAAPVAIAGKDRSRLLEPAGEIPWITFSRPEIARLVSRGEVVFVDVTADWCLTCKANKALVLERGEVLATLQSDKAIPMQADWTRPDDVIARFLEDNGRFGIPFNIVYGPSAPEGIALPEILTTNAILDAMEQAAPIAGGAVESGS